MYRFVYLSAFLLLVSGCDHGFEPPEPSFGTIEGTIHFEGDWPPAEEVRVVRFVALPFKPANTDDILLRLSEIVLSQNIQTFVDEADFTIVSVPTGRYVYNIVVLQFGDSTLDVRVIGEYTQNTGEIFVSRDETTTVDITVDFDNPPEFPPR